MKNIEEIKAQLAELTAKVNELETTQTGDYVFTKEQMYEFVCKLHSGFVTSTEHNLSANFEADTDCVGLELSGNEIIVEIDSSDIITNVISCIEDEADLDIESVIDTVDDIYKNIFSL